MNDAVYFLSDTHFKYHNDDEQERKKRRIFLEFLETLHGCSRLYLVGDIFDFWFEYGSVIPKHYNDILCGLKGLSLSGTAIFMTGGNHDYWLGRFLPESLGIGLLPMESTHHLHGRVVTLTHGDSLMPGDRGYKALKMAIRNPFVIWLARLFHPDILYSFAGWFSRASKGLTDSRTEEYAERLISVAEDSFFDRGNDLFVMGHVHLPRMVQFGRKTFVILGDWERHNSYLRLDGDGLSLESYPGGTGGIKGTEKD